MNNVLSLSIENIKSIIQYKKIEKMYDWDGDMDGGELECFLDAQVQNFVRFYSDDKNVYFIDKKLLDLEIDKVDYKPILQRVKDRAEIDNWSTDYLDYYYDLLDPIYVPIIGEETQWVYIYLYDYILDRVSKNYPYQFLLARITNDISQKTRWKNKETDSSRIQKLEHEISALKNIIQYEEIQEYTQVI